MNKLNLRILKNILVCPYLWSIILLFYNLYTGFIFILGSLCSYLFIDKRCIATYARIATTLYEPINQENVAKIKHLQEQIEIQNMIHDEKISNLEQQILNLTEQNTDLIYRPDGIGYKLAQKNFLKSSTELG